MPRPTRFALLLLPLGALVIDTSACGARTGLLVAERDAAVDSHPDAPDGDGDGDGACVPVADGCGRVEICGNGLDDNCNGQVDEGCSCTPGKVQPCFKGPPGRRNVGVCRDGTQGCQLARFWGPCVGGIWPRPDVCNGSDNLCTGCSQQTDCPISCPSGKDPRVVDGQPFTDYALRGEDFYPVAARSWTWTVKGGPCDQIAQPSFDVTNALTRDATFTPKLSGDYEVTLTVVTISGNVLSCTWVVHIAGPGLRVEMCYPESTTQDLDLLVHKPGSTLAWYEKGGSSFDPNPDACGWFNCEAHLRPIHVGPKQTTLPRADWGYAKSPLSECIGSLYGAEWKALGYCANPRLDVDNNLQEATGVPENINIDKPKDGETFRVMVQNFTGRLAHPLVNIYCEGSRIATYGAPPDQVPKYEGTQGMNGVGAMWRAVDVTVHVDDMGRTTCDPVQLHPPGSSTGYDVTYDNPRY